MELVKLIHLSCAVLTLIGFVGRGILVYRHSPYLSRRWLKIAPHIIDTLLLGSAIYMAINLSLIPWESSWLGVKILLVLVYIGLGMVAMNPRYQTPTRLIAWASGILVFIYIVSIALTKSPTLITFS